ncbi:Alpha/Beta hydrolase protein [Cristinia sonorae]|uniref:Alpha/Beta hydrolase protein n=1 Tax=Cristinia sonorae TaxID=1940300 RepID=A0A8K0UWY1_9AGAR|nr:Alpha/Beta hydrolase protein [Cristinia sonorae]
MLPNSTVRQLQFVIPSTGTAYAQYQNSLPSKPPVVSESIGHGAWLHWIGPKENKKVMYYLHGGGFVMPASDGHFKMADWWRTEAKKRYNIDFSVAFLEYSLMNFEPWPAQLVQAAAGLTHLLEQGYDPSNITVVGDSAGGHATVFLLAHLLHPHPDAEPITLEKPLAGAVSMSAWLSYSMDTTSFKRWGPKDVVAPLSGLKTWSKLFIDTRKRTDDPYYFEPAHAPATWWEGLDKVSKNVLLTAGDAEGMFDDIINTAKRMEEGAGKGDVKVASYVQEGVNHNEALVDFACGDLPGSTNFRVLGWIKEVYA